MSYQENRKNKLQNFIDKSFKYNKKFNFVFYFFLFFAIVLFVFFILKSRELRAILYLILFIIINMIISTYKRFIKLPIEIEFMTLGIVLLTYIYGLKIGLIFAIIGGILSFIVGFNISPFSFPMLLGYIIMCFITFLFQYINIGISLIFIGIIASLINNIFVFLFYHFVFKYDLIKNISYSVSNFLFNFLFLSVFYDFFLKIFY